ncbi:hypothetical protein CANARDRAFT_7323 [[Candida] arabinofermentans NRRL YB-2248]|uniref:BZIP domain-containing protein n=1 Tax=[Candida] arabinofermentans NRRL YB-2248 TaxID=983967 RepID=A0A1E4T2J2_9ASCO|nr:hypothetical protein CANARDRAFT_7323 [[Candida] arabinofermentans NRRL YB-2248]
MSSYIDNSDIKRESNFNLDDFDFDFYNSSSSLLTAPTDDLSLFSNNQFQNLDADQLACNRETDHNDQKDEDDDYEEEYDEEEDYDEDDDEEAQEEDQQQNIDTQLTNSNTRIPTNDTKRGIQMSESPLNDNDYNRGSSPSSSYSTVTIKSENSPANLTKAEQPVEGGQKVTHIEKRRRNTLASARFRIKKKQREREMAMNFKFIHERITSLKVKIKTLEMENKCLKEMLLNNNSEQSNGGLFAQSTSNYELLKILKQHSGDSFKITSV